MTEISQTPYSPTISKITQTPYSLHYIQDHTAPYSLHYTSTSHDPPIQTTHTPHLIDPVLLTPLLAPHRPKKKQKM